MYTIIAILICLAFWLAGCLIYAGSDLFKNRSLKSVDGDVAPKNLLIKSQVIDWQEIIMHVRLDELLCVHGKTLSGENFQIILSLGIGTKLHLIYLRVGSIIHRVPAGQAGIIEVKQGDAFRLIFENHDVTLTPLLNSIDASNPEQLIGDNYFALVLSLTNSLVDGLKISYAARCASLEGSFIKIWDIPNPQSDASIRSQISSISDLAALAEKVNEVQMAKSFISKTNQPRPLDYGVCYLLGKSGGMRLRFVIDSEVAFLIVSEFNPDINLSDFLKSLAVCAQMHAKIVKKSGAIHLAAQNKDGDYSFVSLAMSNVILSVQIDCDKTIPVVRIELDEDAGGVLDVYYQNSSGFNNVLIWKNIGRER